MIISIGMRTDIINYYTPWLLKRIKEEYAYSRNPYYPELVYKVSLKPEDIDTMIMCSKNYKPILPYLPQISKKYPLYCHYTITAYDKDMEPFVPSIDDSINTLIELSIILGKKSIAWRYDPILLTHKYTIEYHLKTFEYICSKINNHIDRCIFSFVEMYPRFQTYLPDIIPLKDSDKIALVKGLGAIAKKYGIHIQICGSNDDYTAYGVHRSGCVTLDILSKANNLNFKHLKHNGIRKGCHCIEQKSIGAYNTCLNGCRYCYANKKPYECKANYKKHDPNSPLILGHIQPNDKIIEGKVNHYRLNNSHRLDV